MYVSLGERRATRLGPPQNVLLELDPFAGRLGGKNACALCKPPVEVPSDSDGVVWVRKGWKLTLARELRAGQLRRRPKHSTLTDSPKWPIQFSSRGRRIPRARVVRTS